MSFLDIPKGIVTQQYKMSSTANLPIGNSSDSVTASMPCCGQIGVFSVSQFSRVRLCDPMDCSTPGFLVHHQLPELAQTHVHRSGDAIQSNHLILCRPLLPCLQSPSIRVFSIESVLHMRWLKYWSFRFSISPSSDYSGLISFRMDWLDLFAVQGTQES